MINVFGKAVGKAFPTLVKSVGVTGMIEIIGGTTMAVKTFDFVEDKVGSFIKSKIDGPMTAKKQELLKKQKEMYEQKITDITAQIEETPVDVEDVEVVQVEEKPKTSKRRPNK